MLTPAVILEFCAHYPATGYVIAYSGGLDSHVLLHLCARAAQHNPALTFRAIHIHHGLHSDAQVWATHCATICRELTIPFQCATIQVKTQQTSLEAAAREARYAMFEQLLQEGEILLSAHHQNDQAETVILNLMRQSGNDGLAAMPVIRRLGHFRFARPLLNECRENLTDYAQHHALSYVTDPSNVDQRFDRNYVRHTVLPVFKARWPQVVQQLTQVAQLQADTRQVLAYLLPEKLQQITAHAEHALYVKFLLTYPSYMQLALLRFWLQQLEFTLPNALQLKQIQTEVLHAKEDGTPCVRWKHAEVRRYQGILYALPPTIIHDPTQIIEWSDVSQPLQIPHLKTTIMPCVLNAWSEHLKNNCVTVRFRQGGERVLHNGMHKTLKHLFQEYKIPPWERDKIPLIYVGKSLISLHGIMAIAPCQGML